MCPDCNEFPPRQDLDRWFDHYEQEISRVRESQRERDCAFQAHSAEIAVLQTEVRQTSASICDINSKMERIQDMLGWRGVLRDAVAILSLIYAVTTLMHQLPGPH